MMQDSFSCLNYLDFAKAGGKRRVLKKETDMEILQLLSLLCCFWFAVQSETLLISEAHCPQHQRLNIGVVIDESSRVGREQKIAMELAVQDFDHRCLKLLYSRGNSASAASSAVDLISHKQVDAIVGTVTLQEAALISEFSTGRSIPIISLSPAASDLQQMAKMTSFIQVSTPITYQLQCVAALIGHFRWRKAILIHEQGNSFSEESGLFTCLSDSLLAVGSLVEHHVAFPRVSSLLDPKALVEKELKKLRSKNVRIFILMQSSLEFSVVLFEKAKESGMLGKGYVWIVSAEITNLLDSVNSSVILNMQGVVGLKIEYTDNTDFIKTFKSRFRRKYGSEYSAEEDTPEPSIYSFQAYDSIKSLAMASRDSEAKIVSLVNHTSFSKFEGRSGKISFKNSVLSQKPVFWIINVIGKSYREVALWTPEFGFSEDLVELEEKRMNIGSGLTRKLSPIYWPGGEQNVPNGWSIGSIKAPLRIGVPANDAFHQFVEVTYDRSNNQTVIGGFSIKVFEAAVKLLPYDLHYEYVPFSGNTDEMVAAVHNKSLDAAVGETVTLAQRYVLVDFSLPYISESGPVMVVSVKQELKQSRFIALNAFTWKMWVQLGAMSVSTGAIVWLSEYASGNVQFTMQSIPELICSVAWLSVTMISLSQRETVRSTASKLVLGAWICVVFVVGASYTAILSSMMTVPRLQGGPGIDYLRNTNAAIGCNVNSFTCRYLINALQFKPQNVHGIHSVDDYPRAFERGEIQAAFFITPHAKVFIAKNCKGYTIAGHSYHLGGSAFVRFHSHIPHHVPFLPIGQPCFHPSTPQVFRKGSQLAIDISEAVLKLTESGDIYTMEEKMLLQYNCSPSANGREKTDEWRLGPEPSDDLRLGPEPFSGLFQVLAGIIGVAFVTSMIQLVRKKWSDVHDLVQETLLMKRTCRWTLFVLTKCRTRFGSSFQQTNAPCDQMDQNLVSIQLPTLNTS